MIRLYRSSFIFVSLMIFPIVLWYEHTGSLVLYLDKSVPNGQLMYVLSKLFGLMAMFGLVWQVIITLARKITKKNLGWFEVNHKVFGLSVMVLCLLHVFLFVSAVSSRQGSIAWGVLVPNFKDHYHTYVALGVFALLMLVTVIITGMARYASKGRFYKNIHKGYWVLITLVYFHAFTIGSEMKSMTAIVLYSLLASIAGLLSVKYYILIKNNKLEKIT